MAPSLVVVGLSHRTAPVEVRERLALPEDKLPDAHRKVAALGAGEAMILSTCNRVEIYLAAPGDAGAEAVARAAVERLLCDESGLPPSTLTPHLYTRAGEPALRHLFRVAASLDSMVVGEPQILGQVKEAFERATQAGTVGALLGRALPRAFAAAKRVRSETAVARNPASVASAAVELASQIFGALDGRDVMIVGAGEMAQHAARHLRAAGARGLVCVNRTESRAVELAQAIGGEARPFADLEALLGKVDIVVSSTGAREPIITRAMVQRGMKARRGRFLCLIDIAVPRDVEASVTDVENVYLYDVDGLERLVDDHLAERRREAEGGERIVDEELARWTRAEKTAGVVPTIKALREKFLAVARAEAERTTQKLGDAHRRDVEGLANAIVNKLLHAPLTALKRDAESEALLECARTLFALDDEAALPAAPAVAAAGGVSDGQASDQGQDKSAKG